VLAFAFPLLVVAAGLGFYAQANAGGQDFTLFGSTWHTYTWVPTAIASGAVTLVCIALMVWSMLRIRGLERANAALQNDVNLYQLERVTKYAGFLAAQADAERDLVGRSEPPAEPIAPPADPARGARTDAEHIHTFPIEAVGTR
jgi:hypothetical protein